MKFQLALSFKIKGIHDKYSVYCVILSCVLWDVCASVYSAAGNECSLNLIVSGWLKTYIGYFLYHMWTISGLILPVNHASSIRHALPEWNMVHPKEILQVFVLSSCTNLSQALELCYLATALLPFFLLQRLLWQEAAQATADTLTHGWQRQYFAPSSATSTANATASTYPSTVSTPRWGPSIAPRLGHLSWWSNKIWCQNQTEVW